MATLSITVADVSLARVQEAFGHAVFSPLGVVPPTETWVNATNIELRQAIMEFIRIRVRQYEEEKAAKSAKALVVDI